MVLSTGVSAFLQSRGGVAIAELMGATMRATADTKRTTGFNVMILAPIREDDSRASDQKVGIGFWKNLMRFKRLKVADPT
jgi:hypothetical protein